MTVTKEKAVPHDEWRALLNSAYEMVELAGAYADDGAYLTAADRLESAAKLFREGHHARNAAFGLDQ